MGERTVVRITSCGAEEVVVGTKKENNHDVVKNDSKYCITIIFGRQK